jgi:nucleoside-diphosphate-sugar epimerase
MGSGGDQRADHTYIEDFVQGAVRAFEIKEPKNRIFNISGGKGYTFNEMARMVEKIVPGADITVGSGLLEYADGMDAPQKGALSIRRAQSELGYQPKYDLFEGLKKYADILRKEGMS